MTKNSDVRISTERIRARGVGRLAQAVPLALDTCARGEHTLVWYELEYSSFQNPLPRLALGMADESELSNSTLAGLSEVTIADRDRPIRLAARRLRACNASDQEVEFFPGIVDSIAVWHADCSEADHTLSADLSSSGILESQHHRVFSYRGTVEPSVVPGPFPGLSWRGRNGQLFSLQLDFRPSRGSGEGGVQADVLLERPRVLCRLRAPSSSDHAGLLDELEHELEDVLPLFSLLSRRPIWWRRLLIESFAAGKRSEEWSSFRLYGGEPKHSVETLPYWRLVHARHLAEHNAFEQLVASLRSARERDSLLRAAQLLTASYVEQSWEAAYALAMAALEALLSGLEEATPSGFRILSASWERVAATVRETLRNRAEAGDLSVAQLEAVLEKVPELRRPPLKTILQKHVARLNVRTDDLWASHERFEEGISEALKQRNSLLHTGSVESPEEASGNLGRVRIFVERLFLRTIGCPETLLAEEHSQAAASANRAREVRSNPGAHPIESWLLVPKRWRQTTTPPSEKPGERDTEDLEHELDS